MSDLWTAIREAIDKFHAAEKADHEQDRSHLLVMVPASMVGIMCETIRSMFPIADKAPQVKAMPAVIETYSMYVVDTKAIKPNPIWISPNVNHT